MEKPKTIDEYLSHFPDATRAILQKIRETIRTAAPSATESIAYGMPAYKLAGRPLVYFAGYDHHIGFYATPSGHAAFAEELSNYRQGKGSVQFPIDEPIPYELIAKIVQFRVRDQAQQIRKKKN